MPPLVASRNTHSGTIEKLATAGAVLKQVSLFSACCTLLGLASLVEQRDWAFSLTRLMATIGSSTVAYCRSRLH